MKHPRTLNAVLRTIKRATALHDLISWGMSPEESKVFCNQVAPHIDHQKVGLAISGLMLFEREAAKAGASRQCPECKKKFHPIRSDAKFCSPTCRQKAFRKKKAFGKKIVRTDYPLRVTAKPTVRRPDASRVTVNGRDRINGCGPSFETRPAQKFQRGITPSHPC